MADPAHRHGGPDAGWYVPGPDGWQRISDAEVWDHDDAAHFGSDPNGITMVSASWAGTVNADGVPLHHGEPMVEYEPGRWMTADSVAVMEKLREWHADHGALPA